ncbi:T6SS immunity protein Tdi1 domain-containing protein [Spongiimicrobium salis]|uniref:T6SS immunity protein Tdi1 domain-containing protein n=1 Tax=Spongiimicrobium salis TaxID=1667022 RepID=UPI00374D8634
MVDSINKAWHWLGFHATKIIGTNDFGNVIFKTENGEFWRLCPEEISCKKIAASQSELDHLYHDSQFIEDWEMTNFKRLAKSELGELHKNQKYCLKKPAAIGGKYVASNIGKISFEELISFSGSLGFQIKDLKDGQKIKLNIQRET